MTFLKIKDIYESCNTNYLYPLHFLYKICNHKGWCRPQNLSKPILTLHFILFIIIIIRAHLVVLRFKFFFFIFNPIFKPKFIIFKTLIIAFHFLFNLHYSFQTLRDLIFPILLYLFHRYPIFFLFLIFLLLYS